MYSIYFLLVQQDSRVGLDVFQSILTTLDPGVVLKVLILPPDPGTPKADAVNAIAEQSRQVARAVTVQAFANPQGPDIVQQANEGQFDLIMLPVPEEIDRAKPLALPVWMQHVVQTARCRVLLVVNPVLPTELAD